MRPAGGPARAPARYRPFSNGDLICLQLLDDCSKVASIDNQTKMIEVAIYFFAKRTMIVSRSWKKIDDRGIVNAHRRETNLAAFK